MKTEGRPSPGPAMMAQSPIMVILFGFIAECLALVLTIKYLPSEMVAGITLLTLLLAVYIFIAAEKNGISPQTRLRLDFLKIFLFTSLGSLLVMGPEDSIAVIIQSIFVVNLVFLLLLRRDF